MLEVEPHFWILCFFLVDWAFGINKCSWSLIGGRELLTQGPAPDPKCKVNILLFLILARLLDYAICTRNVMLIVLILQMVGGWEE